jgi:hypothetical protein
MKTNSLAGFCKGTFPDGVMLQLITGTADFIRHFPHMSAEVARQHPQQSPLLSGAGAGGGGDGKTGGGLTRRATVAALAAHSLIPALLAT